MTSIELTERPVDVLDNIQAYRVLINQLLQYCNLNQAFESGIDLNTLGYLLAELDTIELQVRNQIPQTTTATTATTRP